MQKEALEEGGPVPRGPAGKIDALSPFGTAGSHWAASLLGVPRGGWGCPHVSELRMHPISEEGRGAQREGLSTVG